MNQALFEKLNMKGLISTRSIENIRKEAGLKNCSVFWELNALLYLGVLLLTSGLGMLVYTQMNHVGHLTVISCIGVLSAVSYIYCLRKKLPFSTDKVQSKSIFMDYLLVLSCLCFLIFISYWQYEYQILGSQWGLVSFITTIFLFFTAYYFDHLGILCLAISNMAAWAGIVINPTGFFSENHFASAKLITTGIALGVLFVLAGRLSRRRLIKAHFAFTYVNFGLNFIYLFCIAGLMTFDRLFFIWLPLIALAGWFMYKEAMTEKSFYFLLMIVLYSYFGFSLFVLDLPIWALFEPYGFYMICFYFIGSGAGLAYLLIKLNKKFKTL
jgi:hypothetical protein